MTSSPACRARHWSRARGRRGVGPEARGGAGGAAAGAGGRAPRRGAAGAARRGARARAGGGGGAPPEGPARHDSRESRAARDRHGRQRMVARAARRAALGPRRKARAARRRRRELHRAPRLARHRARRAWAARGERAHRRAGAARTSSGRAYAREVLSPMRTRTIAVLGVGAFLFFLAATVPARFVAAEVQGRSAGGVEFLETDGTLWNGSAKARIATPGGPFTLERIEWHFLPARLAAGRLAFDVSASGKGVDANAQVARAFSGWELASLKAAIQASTITAVLPLAAAWRPEGRIEIISPRLAWNEREARGAASAQWRDAAVALTDVRPLGAYRLGAAAAGGTPRIALAPLSVP